MPATNSTWSLQQRIKQLEKELTKVNKILAQLKPMAQVYGIYRGNDNKEVPCVITNAFPRAGTLDIVVFDNAYSGGKTEISCALGSEKGEARPYLSVEEPEEDESETEAEEESDELVVATKHS